MIYLKEDAQNVEVVIYAFTKKTNNFVQIVMAQKYVNQIKNHMPLDADR